MRHAIRAPSAGELVFQCDAGIGDTPRLPFGALTDTADSVTDLGHPGTFQSGCCGAAPWVICWMRIVEVSCFGRYREGNENKSTGHRLTRQVDS